MEPWIIYAIVALSISLTSYLNIYKPAVELYIEVTEEEKPVINSIIYKIVWLGLAFILAPFIALMLIKGQNDDYIRNLVVAWIGDDDDDDE
jgi:hypothetical protein